MEVVKPIANVTSVGTTILDIASTVGDLLTGLFDALAKIFVTVDGTSGAFEFTVFGYLLLFTAVLVVAIFIIRWIASLIKFKSGN